MKKTKILISSMLSASLLTVAGCQDTPADIEDNSNTDPDGDATYYETAETEFQEVELEHLQPQFPDLDLDAVEDYLEDNQIEVSEEELVAYLTELQESGEPVSFTEENSSFSSFPWWLFLMSSSKYSKTPVSKPKVTTGTKPSSASKNKNSTASSKPTPKSGFGSGKSTSSFGG